MGKMRNSPATDAISDLLYDRNDVAARQALVGMWTEVGEVDIRNTAVPGWLKKAVYWTMRAKSPRGTLSLPNPPTAYHWDDRVVRSTLSEWWTHNDVYPGGQIVGVSAHRGGRVTALGPWGFAYDTFGNVAGVEAQVKWAEDLLWPLAIVLCVSRGEVITHTLGQLLEHTQMLFLPGQAPPKVHRRTFRVDKKTYAVGFAGQIHRVARLTGDKSPTVIMKCGKFCWHCYTVDINDWPECPSCFGSEHAQEED